MSSVHDILKELNILLESKYEYSLLEYEKKLLELKDKIDHYLLTEHYREVNEKEQELILQQYKILIKMT